MELSRLRTWQWMGIGIVVGLLLSWSQLSSDITTEFPLQRSDDQMDFERLIAARSWSGSPRVKDLIVYPTDDGKYLVSYQRLMRPGNDEQPSIYQPFIFLAEGDYMTARRRGDVGRGEKMHFLDYLEAMKEENEDLSYTYAWWRDKRYVLPVWTGGSFLLIGVIWPLVIHLLIRAGFVPKPQQDPEYDLDRFGHYQEPGKPKVSVAAVEAEVQRNLARGIASGQPEPETSQVAKLPSEPLTGPPVQEKPEDPKDYKGEFYPVAKGKKG